MKNPFCTSKNTGRLLEAGTRLLRSVLNHIPPKTHLNFEGKYEWTFSYLIHDVNFDWKYEGTFPYYIILNEYMLQTFDKYTLSTKLCFSI